MKRFEVKIKGSGSLSDAKDDEMEVLSFTCEALLAVKAKSVGAAKKRALEQLQDGDDDGLTFEVVSCHDRSVLNECRHCHQSFWWHSKAAFCTGVCAEDYRGEPVEEASS